MVRRALLLLALLALSQSSVVLAEDVDDKMFDFGDASDIFDKFLGDLNDTWHGLKHHDRFSFLKKKTPPAPTGTAEPLIKQGRRLSGKVLPTGATGATGPVKKPSKVDAIINDKKEAILNKTEAIVDKKEEVKTDVTAFFQDALATLKDRLDENRSGFAAAFEKHSNKFANITAGVKDRLAVGYEKLSTDSFLSDILGKNYTSYFPNSFNLSDWSQLGAFSFDNTLSDFADNFSFKNLTDFGSIKDLSGALSSIESAFCKNETVKFSKKVPTTCTGPAVTLELVPRSCVLDSKSKTLICDPAKLVLNKVPGSCTFKYLSAFSYRGKECRITSSVGLTKDAVLGGQAFSVVLENLKKDMLKNVAI